MHTADDNVHIVVNGELYDYDQLRSEMVDKKQYHFKGHSDSELVLALYQFYGMSFLSHLRGKFSFACTTLPDSFSLQHEIAMASSLCFG
jgi:asparagine synthase (glutamine-hydrolysing)